MEKLTRHRKAFYQKENDYKNGNHKLELHKSFDAKYINHSLEHHQPVPHHKIPQLQVKKISKNNTELYCEHYGLELLHNAANFHIPSRFLSNHKIDWNLRARMLDWMVEVMTSYKFSDKTYFASVQLMDRYFQKQTQQIQPTKLHIIGVVCMMIASKMQQVYPLKLKTVYQKIAHKKIPEQQLLQLQQRISYVLDFKLNSWTFYDLAMTKVHLLLQNLTQRRFGALTNITNNYFSTSTSQTERSLIKQIEQKLSQIQQIISYLSKYLIYDYDYYISNTLSLYCDVILKLTFEILKIPYQLEVIYGESSIQIEVNKQELKSKIFKYDSKYKGINNLKKFIKQDTVKLVEKEIFHQNY